MSISRKANEFLFPWLLYLLAFAFSLFLLASLFVVEIPTVVKGKGWFLLGGEIQQISSFHNGIFKRWLVEEGDSIKKDQVIAEIITLDEKKTIQVTSHLDGKISEILIYSGTKVNIAEALAIVTKEGDNRHDLEVMAFVSSLEGKKVNVGMKVLLSPSVTSPYQEGYLLGEVHKVGKLPIAKSSLYSLIKIPEIAKYMRNNVDAEPFLVFIKPIKNDQHKTGYLWSKKGPSFLLDSGIITDVTIIIDEKAALKLICPLCYSLFGER